MVFKRDGTVPKGVRKYVGVFWGVKMTGLGTMGKVGGTKYAKHPVMPRQYHSIFQ